MVREASFADDENEKIRNEFSARERQTTELMKKQQTSLDMLKKIHLEKELTQSSANHQELETRRIVNINTELKL